MKADHSYLVESQYDLPLRNSLVETHAGFVVNHSRFDPDLTLDCDRNVAGPHPTWQPGLVYAGASRLPWEALYAAEISYHDGCSGFTREPAP